VRVHPLIRGSNPPERAEALGLVHARLADSVRVPLDRVLLEPPTGRLVEYLFSGTRSADGAYVVTSCRAGEGVTTVTASVAALLGHSVKRNLLYVDANFRAPAILNEERAPGLCQVLRGELTLAESVRPVLSNLSILPAGPDWPVNPGEFGEDQVSAILGEMRRLYHTVLLDVAPPSESPFSCRLARASDGVVIVVESESTTTDQLAFTVDLLRKGGSEVLGVVFNRCRVTEPF